MKARERFVEEVAAALTFGRRELRPNEREYASEHFVQSMRDSGPRFTFQKEVDRVADRISEDRYEEDIERAYSASAGTWD